MFKIFMIFALVGTCYAGPIKVLGYDGNSKMIVGEMSPDTYIETILMTKDALDKQAITGLKNFHDKGPSWQLAKVSLGLGATGEIGIGLFKFGKSLRHRFVYSK
ncbi:MAG TPA: hypothetical protein VNJ08_16035 [Bacteriovoracaceae bacterium]|nr:hypothetical protein [Bacteriovoracaceae bacterium]